MSQVSEMDSGMEAPESVMELAKVRDWVKACRPEAIPRKAKNWKQGYCCYFRHIQRSRTARRER